MCGGRAEIGGKMGLVLGPESGPHSVHQVVAWARFRARFRGQIWGPIFRPLHWLLFALCPIFGIPPRVRRRASPARNRDPTHTLPCGTFHLRAPRHAHCKFPLIKAVEADSDRDPDAGHPCGAFFLCSTNRQDVGATPPELFCSRVQACASASRLNSSASRSRLS